MEAGTRWRMALKRITLIYGIAVLIPLCAFLTANGQVRSGAERMERYLPLLKNKSVGVVAHPASRIGQRNLVDTLLARGVAVSAIFCPEHGFRNFEEAGRMIKNGKDSATSLPVISLYGKKKKPDPADLNDLDIMVFDLQDVGVRFFTYLSTLSYVMEACAGGNLPLILLDRPNPNGDYIDGPVLEEECVSFLGLHPVPVVYGMTIGEYARMLNEEGWLSQGVVCDLTVITMEGYRHSLITQLPFRPSPNLQDGDAIRLYPTLCLFEGTKVSVGRGTDFPFKTYGFPGYPDHNFFFVPGSRAGKAENPPYKGDTCYGVDLRKYREEHPDTLTRLRLEWVVDAFEKSGKDPKFFNSFFDLLAGNKNLRQQLIQGVPEAMIRESWEPGLLKFSEIRRKYLLYP